MFAGAVTVVALRTDRMVFGDAWSIPNGGGVRGIRTVVFVHRDTPDRLPGTIVDLDDPEDLVVAPGCILDNRGVTELPRDCGRVRFSEFDGPTDGFTFGFHNDLGDCWRISSDIILANYHPDFAAAPETDVELLPGRSRPTEYA